MQEVSDSSSNELHDSPFPEDEFFDTDEVYDDKSTWSDVNDNHTFHFVDGTEAVMKKLLIKKSFLHTVHWVNDLREVCTDLDEPMHVSVILPKLELYQEGNSDQAWSLDCTEFLDCFDCHCIMKIGHFRNFQRGQMLCDIKYLYNFGQVVHDMIEDEKAVVVGQTRYRVYLISATSTHRDNCSNGPKRAYVRYHRDVSKHAYPVALNYRVVSECAKMTKYVVRHSESAYNIH